MPGFRSPRPGPEAGKNPGTFFGDPAWAWGNRAGCRGPRGTTRSLRRLVWNSQLCGTTSSSLFLVAAPLKMGFPQKGFPFFPRVTEQLRLGRFLFHLKRLQVGSTASRIGCGQNRVGIPFWGTQRNPPPTGRPRTFMAGGQNRFGIPFWGVFGEFTTHFKDHFLVVGLNRMFTGANRFGF